MGLPAYYKTKHGKLFNGDSLETLKKFPDNCIQCCVTSPPYWGLRDYGVEGQLGLEKTPEEYVSKLVKILREVKRVLKGDGTLWLNLGDSYNGSGGAGGDYNKGGLKEGQPRYPGRKVHRLKPKDLVGIPWMVAFASRADGWYLRQDIIWHKPNPMPEGVTDRCTKAHEYVFLLSKSKKYYYDSDAIKEPAKYAGDDRGSRSDSRRGTRMSSMSGKTGSFKNKRSVWTITTKPYKEAHFATFPEELITPCIMAGTQKGQIVLDPFAGSNTVGVVSERLKRKWASIELNKKYCDLSVRRTEIGDLVNSLT